MIDMWPTRALILLVARYMRRFARKGMAYSATRLVSAFYEIIRFSFTDISIAKLVRGGHNSYQNLFASL